MNNAIQHEIKTRKSIWVDPSNQLLSLTLDKGCIQRSHSDLERLYVYLSEIKENTCDEDFENAWEWCFDSDCGNCVLYGYPCINFQIYGKISSKLVSHWKYFINNNEDVEDYF